MTQQKYCRQCGLELVKRELPGFSELTGERNYRMECPTGICEHTGCWHEDVPKRGVFNFLMGHFHCKKCGRDGWDH